MSKNQLRQCNCCDKIWQTHECNEKLFRCPNCGSTKKYHTDMSIHGNRLFTSRILTHDAYNELIFGSERGRTWHDSFGKLKGYWVIEHKLILTKDHNLNKE